MYRLYLACRFVWNILGTFVAGLAVNWTYDYLKGESSPSWRMERSYVVTGSIVILVLAIFTVFAWLAAREEIEKESSYHSGRNRTPGRAMYEQEINYNVVAGLATLGNGIIFLVGWIGSAYASYIIGYFDDLPGDEGLDSQLIEWFRLSVFVVLCLAAVAMFRLYWLQDFIFGVVCYAVCSLIGGFILMIVALFAYGPNSMSSSVGALLLPLFGALLGMGVFYVYSPKD